MAGRQATRAMGAVLVTGASSGIGLACVNWLATRGFDVFAGVRRRDDAPSPPPTGGRITPLVLDVTRQQDIDAAAELVAEAVGGRGLAGLVNNAGIGRVGPVEALPPSVWREQLEVNVVGQIAVTQALLPVIRRANGRIVFVGSTAGRIAVPWFGPYAASKHALEAVAASLRAELQPWRIQVAVVGPGAVCSPISAKGRASADDLESAMDDAHRALYAAAPDAIRRYMDQQERWCIPPDRVAAAVDHALTSRRPKLRYPVGRDATFTALAARFAPDRALARLVRGPRRRPQ